MALHSYRLCALLFIAIMLAESRAEESDGTGSSAAAVSTPTVYSGLDKKIAGYTPASDVDAHKMIDVDMMMIEEKFSSCTPGAAMTEATSIYTTGRNSKKSSGFRNIKGFELKAKEPLGDLFIAYKTADKHDPHALVEAALAGADITAAGPAKALWGNHTAASGATGGAIAGSCDARKQIVQKTAKFQIMMQYAAHEFEAALAAYTNCQYDKAVHYWDEWWAFYAGSKAGAYGGPEAFSYAPYMLPKKRADNFGTNTKKSTLVDDESAVNCILLTATKQGLELLKTRGNDARLTDISQCMRAQLKVGLIQGCLRYGYKTACGVGYASEFSGCSASVPYPAAALKAEMAAFCSGAAVFLHEVNAADAEKLRLEYTMETDTKVPDWTKVKAVFSQKNLNKMGVKCGDIGSGAAGDGSAGDYPNCTDVAADFTNAHADSNKCSAVTDDPCTCVSKTPWVVNHHQWPQPYYSGAGSPRCHETCQPDHACSQDAPDPSGCKVHDHDHDHSSTASDTAKSFGATAISMVLLVVAATILV